MNNRVRDAVLTVRSREPSGRICLMLSLRDVNLTESTVDFPERDAVSHLFPEPLYVWEFEYKPRLQGLPLFDCLPETVPAAVEESRRGCTIYRCPDCNAWHAQIMRGPRTQFFRCEECGVHFAVGGFAPV